MKTIRVYPRVEFFTSELKIGEMMEVELGESHILLKTNDGLVSLTNPNFTWSNEYNIIGRKLDINEGITLIQT